MERTDRARRLQSGANEITEEETFTSDNKSESSAHKAETSYNKAESSSSKAVSDELQKEREKRNKFWQDAVQYGGRPEVWEALKVVAEAELKDMPQLLKANNIQLGKEDLTVFRDSDGTEYILPLFVLRVYNLIGEW